MALFKKMAYGASAAALLALAAPVAAYAQQTTANLRGIVLDAEGNPVSGATVTIEHAPTGNVSTATTSANGNFFEAGLRPGGPYTVTVTSNGESESAENIRLSAGTPNTFNAVLGASDSEVIVVRGTAVQNDLGLNSGVGTVFDAADLANQPSIQRDVISSLLADPFVTSTNFDGRGRANGTISVAGQAPRFNGFVVDGLLQGNDFGLDQGLFPTLRQPISIDWIEETSVQASDYSVLSGGFTGGVVNVVSKQGGNEFDGGLYYYFRDESFVGDESNDQTVSTDNFTENEWGAYLSGPIVEDKLFFFVGYEEFENSRPLNFDFGDTDPAAFDLIRDITQSVYNYDPGSKSETSIDELAEKYTVRLDWDINDNHRATASLTHTEDNLLSGISTFGFPTNYYNLSSEQDFYRVELNSDWTDNLSTVFRFSRKEYVRGQDSLGDTSATGTSFGAFVIEVDPSDPYFANNGLDGAALIGSSDVEFELGPDVFRHHNAFSDERTSFYGQADYAWSSDRWGDHVFTFGGSYEEYELFNVFGQFSRGEFQFESLTDYVNQTAEINYINAQSNNSDDVATAWGFDTLVLFAQDNWQVTPTLNVNYGVRYEHFYQDDVPPAPEAVINGTGTGLQSFEDTYGFSGTDNLDGVSLLQPRVGFTWDAKDNLTLSGGVGIYSGGSPQVWTSNNFTPATFAAFGFGPEMGVTGSSIPQGLQDVISAGVGVPPGFNAVQNIDVFDPSFDMPHVLRASLRADYELDLDRWGLGDGYFVSASILYGDQRQSLTWQNLAFERGDLLFTPGVAPDGRPIYPDLGDQPIAGDPDNLDTDENTNGDEFNVPDAFMITTRPGGESLSYALQVAKAYENGFSFNTSYTYTEAEDLLEYTSSRAVSAWRGIIGTDRNNPVVATSSNEIQHKFVVQLNYERDFIQDLTSQFTVFGIVQSGQPFSYGYDVGSRNPVFGRANGGSPRDGADLIYIPTGPADPLVEFETPQDEADFNAYIAARGLEGYRGQVVPRNSDRSPWSRRFDFRFQQELPGIPGADRFVGDNRFKFVFDVENFLNLLNSDWGQQYNRGGFFGRARVADVELRELAGGEILSDNEPAEFCRVSTDCRYVYSGVENPDDVIGQSLNNSVWRVRMGIRYEF